MKIVYIAGPFRADTAWDVECNVRRAENMALEVAKCGVMPLCPHTNTRFFNGLLRDDFWIRGTQEMVKRSDALLLLSGWRKSEGTLAEVELAKELGIPILHNFSEFTEWVFNDYSMETVYPLQELQAAAGH